MLIDFYGKLINISEISYEDNDMTVTHEVDMAAREPLVVVILKKDGKEEIRVSTAYGALKNWLITRS